MTSSAAKVAAAFASLCLLWAAPLSRAQDVTSPAAPPPAPAAAPATPAPETLEPRPVRRWPPGPPVAIAPPVAAPPGGPRQPLAHAQPIPQAELEAYVDGAVAQAMADLHVAGVTVAVVQDGQTVLLKGYGMARQKPDIPVDPRVTLFRLGSLSEVFTRLATAKAVEARKFGWDAPIRGHLPPDFRLDDKGFEEPVRVRHLATHTGGFEERRLGRLYRNSPERIRPLEQQLDAMNPHRVRAPGALASRSTYGPALLGLALARAYQAPFEDVAAAQVFRPMGMGRTTFREPYPARADLPTPMSEAFAATLASGFRWTDHGLRAEPYRFAAQLAPAAGAVTTAQDMARFMTVLLAGGAAETGPVYGPETARAVGAVLQRNAAELNGVTTVMSSRRLPGGIDGLGLSGDGAAFNAALVLAPSLRLGVFIATNTETGAPLTNQLAAGLVGRFYGEGPAPKAAAPADLSHFAGRFISVSRSYRGLERLVDRLTRLSTVRVDADGHLIVDDGRGARTYAATGAPGRFQGPEGESLVFPMPSGGAAPRMMLLPSGTEAAERLSLIHQPMVLLSVLLVGLAAALGSLWAIPAGMGREYRETPAQSRAGWMKAFTSLLWVLGGVLGAVWFTGSRTTWPNPILIAGSSCALAATLFSLIMLLQLPRALRTDRRGMGWSAAKRLRHAYTVFVFLALGVVLAAWGALEPWSS